MLNAANLDSKSGICGPKTVAVAPPQPSFQVVRPLPREDLPASL
jgi:hypothetical protein